jgi:hypothetical protein
MSVEELRACSARMNRAKKAKAGKATTFLRGWLEKNKKKKETPGSVVSREDFERL